MPCQLPAASPTNNGELDDQADADGLAWAECAAQVDMIYRHQQAQP